VSAIQVRFTHTRRISNEAPPPASLLVFHLLELLTLFLSQLPDFLPSKFDLQVKNSDLDKATDFVAGDKRVETQGGSRIHIENIEKSPGSKPLHPTLELISDPFFPAFFGLTFFRFYFIMNLISRSVNTVTLKDYNHLEVGKYRFGRLQMVF
jgi:hypothetical protein